MTHLSELVDLGGSAAAVATASDLGLIDSLARPATPTEHASRLGLDPEAVELVLDALVALGVAEKQDGRFGASGALDDAAGSPLDSLLPTHELWEHLPRFLRTGERYARMDGSPRQRATAYRDVVGALGRLFEPAADDLAAKLPPPGEEILDIGAGSGVWSLAMCARSSTSHVTALDLPEVLPAFIARAEQLRLADRVDTVCGDFHSTELRPRSFDRIVIANVLHLEAAARARSLVARVAPALRPGGDLVVIDALARGDPFRERARSIYALHLAMRTSEGVLHSRSTIEGWCREAGLSDGSLVAADAPPWTIAALVHRAT